MIGISLLTLSPGRMGGSETYVRALTAALANVGSVTYLVAVRPDASDAAAGLPTVLGPSGSSRRWRLFLSARRARALLAGADAVHFPLTVALPRVNAPRILTLHDLVHRDLPRLVPRVVRAFRAREYDGAAESADRVIVPSRFVRDRCVVRLGLDPSRIRVIPHGIDHGLFHPGTDDPAPFLLYPARSWPHKNHRKLFDAFELVRRERADLTLVLTGASFGAAELPDGVRSLGRVSEQELAELYRRAAVMVFPSIYEGFALPVVEAMASGCPVAAAAAGAIPEVAGTAAVLFDPHSAGAIAGGVLSALEERERLVADGLARARRYTWDAAAKAHERVYLEVAAGPRRT